MSGLWEGEVAVDGGWWEALPQCSPREMGGMSPLVPSSRNYCGKRERKGSERIRAHVSVCVHVCANISSEHPRLMAGSCSAICGVPGPSTGCCKCGVMVVPYSAQTWDSHGPQVPCAFLPAQGAAGGQSSPSAGAPRAGGPLRVRAACCAVQGQSFLPRGTVLASACPGSRWAPPAAGSARARLLWEV